MQDVSHMHSVMQDNGTIRKGLGILGNKKKNDRIRPKNHHLGFSWNHYLAIKNRKIKPKNHHLGLLEITIKHEIKIVAQESPPGLTRNHHQD